MALLGPLSRIVGAEFGTVTDTTLFGLSIVASAFLLSWAAEAAEVDIAQGLAVAFIAFIAVLPEYAVDITFAWKAGDDPQFAHYAVANMTGGNRLLIGAAWPLIFLLFWFRTRRRVLNLERGYAVEVVALTAATLYSFTIPIKGSISLVDTVVLGSIFAVYLWIISRAPAEEPELVGPARMIGTLPKMQRRFSIGTLFVVAAASIVASAEPFAEGLIHSGTELGIDEFLLVQWLAPFASESPEFLVCSILAWRGRAGMAMGALLSSKVNQWTLLIGSLPIAYSLSGQTLGGLPMDLRQAEEVFLTAAQSFYAVAILLSLSLNRSEALTLLVLFSVQFVAPIVFPGEATVMLLGQEVVLSAEPLRMLIGVIYMVIAVTIFARERGEIPGIVRNFVHAIKDPVALFGAEEHEEARAS